MLELVLEVSDVGLCAGIATMNNYLSEACAVVKKAIRFITCIRLRMTILLSLTPVTAVNAAVFAPQRSSAAGLMDIAWKKNQSASGQWRKLEASDHSCK